MLDFLAGFLNSANVAAAAAINWLISAVVTLAGADIAILRAVEEEASTEQSKWARLIQFLQFQWLLGAGGLLAKLFAAIQKLHDWLQKHIKPIIDFIQKWQKWFDNYYRKYVLPMLNLIQRIRRFLLILRLLHIHIADKLDAWLQKYEAEVNKIFLTIHGTLNQVLGWLSLATNPIGLGRFVLVSITGRRMVAAITRAVTGLPIGHFLPSTSSKAFAFERKPMRASDYLSEATNPPASQILAPLLNFLGTGEYDDQVGVTDGNIDAAEPLLIGQEFINALVAQEQVNAGLDYDGLSVTQALEAKAGNIFNSGYGAAAYCMGLVQSQ